MTNAGWSMRRHERRANSVEHSKWKIRGMALTFERRLAFSADGKQLRAAERITDPRGEVESSCSVPMD